MINKKKYLTNELGAELTLLQGYCVGKGIDVGCANRKVHPDAIGIDIRPTGEKIDRPDDDRVSVADIVADGADLNMFEDESLDYVVSCHNLEHYKDVVKPLQEWLRVLKVGGTLVITLPDDDAVDTIHIDPTHKHVFTRDGFLNLINLIRGPNGCDVFDVEVIKDCVPKWSFMCVLRKHRGDYSGGMPSASNKDCSSWLTVVVAVYNHVDKLKVTLPAFARQTYSDFNIIFADDGSTDGSVRLIEHYIKKWAKDPKAPTAMVYSRPDEGSCKVKCINEAVEHFGYGNDNSVHERLLFIDGDCIPPSDWIEKHANEALQSPDLILAGLYWHILPEDIDKLHRDMFEEDIKELVNEYDWRSQRYHMLDYNIDSWSQTCGCNLSIPTWAFLEVGGYDTEFTGWGTEDNQLAYSLKKKAGLRTKYLDGSVVWHMDHKRLYDSKIDADHKDKLLKIRCKNEDDNVLLVETGITNSVDSQYKDVFSIDNDSEVMVTAYLHWKETSVESCEISICFYDHREYLQTSWNGKLNMNADRFWVKMTINKNRVFDIGDGVWHAVIFIDGKVVRHVPFVVKKGDAIMNEQAPKSSVKDIVFVSKPNGNVVKKWCTSQELLIASIFFNKDADYKMTTEFISPNGTTFDGAQVEFSGINYWRGIPVPENVDEHLGKWQVRVTINNEQAEIRECELTNVSENEALVSDLLKTTEDK